jgi:hypothetical protein
MRQALGMAAEATSKALLTAVAVAARVEEVVETESVSSTTPAADVEAGLTEMMGLVPRLTTTGRVPDTVLMTGLTVALVTRP